MRPWTVLSEKLVRYNRYKSYLKLKYRLPNEKSGYFYIRNAGRIVCALVVTKDNMAVLANQYRPGPGLILGELPGGGVNKNETPRQAIVREVLEETGFRGHVQPIGKSFVNAWTRGIRYHFLITGAVKVAEPSNDDHEISEPVLVSLGELRRRVARGVLTDSETAYRGLERLRGR